MYYPSNGGLKGVHPTPVPITALVAGSMITRPEREILSNL